MEYQVYRTRWLLLGLACVISFFQVFSMSGFVTLNSAVSQYYHVTHYQTDLLAVIGSLLGFPVGLLTAFFGDLLNLRSMMLGTLSLMMIGSTFTTIGFISRSFFYVTATGRVLVTSTFGLMLTTVAYLAANWFPSSETATAFTIPLFAYTLSVVVGSEMYTNIIYSYRDNSSNTFGKYVGPNGVKILFLSSYGSISFILFVSLILGIIYVKNHPPSPPSGSQVDVQKMESDIKESYVERLHSICSILSMKSFILITAASCCTIVLVTNGVILLPSIVLSVFPELDNRSPGQMILVCTLSGCVMMLISARLLDRFKAFKEVSCVGTFSSMLVTLGLFLAVWYRNYPAVFVMFVLLQMLRNALQTASVEFLVETTYPVNKVRLLSIYNAFVNLFVFVWTSTNRMLITHIGTSCAVLLSAVVLAIGTLCLMCVEPNYMRQIANKKTDPEKVNLIANNVGRDS